jgi:hypothetical protein
VLYRYIILDESEGRKALRGPLGEYLRLKELSESTVLDAPQFQILNILGGNTKKTMKYLDNLIRATDPGSFKISVRLAQFARIIGLDVFKKQLSDIYRKGVDLLVTHSQKHAEDSNAQNEEMVTYMDPEIWSLFFSLLPIMDDEDFVYTIKKATEIYDYYDCPNKEMADRLSFVLSGSIQKLQSYPPGIFKQAERLQAYFIGPSDLNQMAENDGY